MALKNQKPRSLSDFPCEAATLGEPTPPCGTAIKRFVRVDRETAYLLPPSVDEWLPINHLARFVVDVIVGADRKLTQCAD